MWGGVVEFLNTNVLSENKLRHRFAPVSPPLLGMKLAQWRHILDMWVTSGWELVACNVQRPWWLQFLTQKPHKDYHSHGSTNWASVARTVYSLSHFWTMGGIVWWFRCICSRRIQTQTCNVIVMSRWYKTYHNCRCCFFPLNTPFSGHAGFFHVQWL